MNSCQPVCRVIVEMDPNPGAWNMAVDEALLEAALEYGESAVRVYKWSRATISLGYFQQAADWNSFPPAADLPVVRRLSGGGAILHEHELTYSIALPPHHPRSRVPAELYESVHQQIINILSKYGILAQTRAHHPQFAVDPFLCFGRANPHDVVFKTQKVLGSAQRRRRGAILQHGSLLLLRSQWAPQFPGIQDLAPDLKLNNQFERKLACGIAAHFGQQLLGGIPDHVRASAVKLERHKYHAIEWNRQG